MVGGIITHTHSRHPHIFNCVVEEFVMVALAPWLSQSGNTVPGTVVPPRGSTVCQYRTHYRNPSGLCGSGYGSDPRKYCGGGSTALGAVLPWLVGFQWLHLLPSIKGGLLPH